MPTQLELLLAQLGGLPPPAPSKPIPYAPVGAPTFPTALGTLPPDIAPTAPPGPQDTGFINRYAGPAPTAPQPLSRGQRIANALVGFNAGLQGRGGEYLAQLQEPQREYQRQLERYQGRRTEAIQIDEQRRQRQQELTQRRADEQSDREFKMWMQRTGVSDQLAIDRLQQAHEVEKEARRQRFETERELEREERRRQDDARQIAGRLGSGPGAAPPHIAKELGEYYANLRQSTSPAAAKWVNAQARRAELLARPAVGGGSGAASRREAQDLQRRTALAATGIANMEKLARQAMESPEEKRGPILGQMRSMAQTLQAQFPELLETGEHNGWPFARLRLRGSQGQQQPQVAPDPLGLR